MLENHSLTVPATEISIERIRVAAANPLAWRLPDVNRSKLAMVNTHTWADPYIQTLVKLVPAHSRWEVLQLAESIVNGESVDYAQLFALIPHSRHSAAICQLTALVRIRKSKPAWWKKPRRWMSA